MRNYMIYYLGFTAYLPTHTLPLVGAVFVLFSFLPMIPATKYHEIRTHKK